MTEALASKTCTACRGGIAPLTREQAEFFHAQAPDWQLAEEAHRIERNFRFSNFREALTFVQEIGELAEAEEMSPKDRQLLLDYLVTNMGPNAKKRALAITEDMPLDEEALG